MQQYVDTCTIISVDPFAPHHCGFEYQQGLWILSCEEAIKLAYRMLVVVLGCPFVPEIMHRMTPEVFFHQ
jgi:hypothetical protein